MTVLTRTPARPGQGGAAGGGRRLVEVVLRARELSILGALVVLVGGLAMGITLSPWSLLALLALSSPR